MSVNRVGVIGWPIEHSLSPVMHNAAFCALAMRDWLYEAIAIPPDELPSRIEELSQAGYVGINVTVPHKQAILKLMQPDAKARAVGAVNTVDFRDHSGTNTDVDGFIDDLKAYDVPITGERVLILGAGGSARAVVYGLIRQGAQVALVNRTPERAQALIDDLRETAAGGDIAVLTYHSARDWNPSLIVNCTPVGMWPQVDGSPWPENVPFPRSVTVYDLIYRPAKTQLMQQAEEDGCQAIGGLGMLVRQGAAAFKIWTGVDPPVGVMTEAVRESLERLL